MDGMAGIFGIFVLPIAILAMRVLMVFFEQSDIAMEDAKFKKVAVIYGVLFIVPLLSGALYSVDGVYGLMMGVMSIVIMPMTVVWFFMHTFYMPRVYVQRARALGKGKKLAYLGTIPLPLPLPLFDLIAVMALLTAKPPQQAEGA